MIKIARTFYNLVFHIFYGLLKHALNTSSSPLDLDNIKLLLTSLCLTLPVLIPNEERKLNLNFYFRNFCGTSKCKRLSP